MTQGEFIASVSEAFERNRNEGTNGFLGAELEGHVFRDDGSHPECIVHTFEHELKAVSPFFIHEVHAGRLEILAKPQRTVAELMHELAQNIGIVDRFFETRGLRFTAEPIIQLPDDHLSVVFPNERYIQAIHDLGSVKARAALQVASLQLHRGVGSWDEALAVYKNVRSNLPLLEELGDLSYGERKRLCETWCGVECYEASNFTSPEDVYHHAVQFGWLGNPKGFWSCLRINCFCGTVELRTPDASRDLEHIRRISTAFEKASRI